MAGISHVDSRSARALGTNSSEIAQRVSGGSHLEKFILARRPDSVVIAMPLGPLDHGGDFLARDLALCPPIQMSLSLPFANVTGVDRRARVRRGSSPIPALASVRP